MKNRKNSHSLSKLNFKKGQFYGHSQKSLNKKNSKRNNQSHIERLATELTSLNNHHEAVRNQYYGTVQQGIYRSQNESSIQKSPEKLKMGKMIHEIEQKMKRVLESQEFDSQIDIKNVVLQQEDIDQEFQDKIQENKHFLKQQRHKQDFTLSQYQNNDTNQIKKENKKKIKKISLLEKKNLNLIGKNKSKSLLPVINPVTSKVFDLYQQKRKQQENTENKNQTQRKILKLQNEYLLPNIRKKIIEKQQHSIYQNKSVESRLKMKSSLQVKSQFNQQIKLNQLHKIISNKKSTQLKLQSKIQELKSKIAQRKTHKQPKYKRSQKVQNLSPHQKVKRYSSHSVFDSIQQFLSNPHQNNSKSQRKFLKLYEKINDNEKILEKQKQTLKKKISIIENKIKIIEQNPHEIIEYKQKIQIPTSAGSSPEGEAFETNGSLIWRRMQGKTIQKSDFENEIKHVNSLQQKGRINLANYIENQKILHELKMIKRTQQILLNRNQRKLKSQTHLQQLM